MLPSRTGAYLLGISVRTCWDVVKSGELPSFKIGARRLIARSALEEMIAAGARPRSVGREHRRQRWGGAMATPPPACQWSAWRTTPVADVAIVGLVWVCAPCVVAGALAWRDLRQASADGRTMRDARDRGDVR